VLLLIALIKTALGQSDCSGPAASMQTEHCGHGGEIVLSCSNRQGSTRVQLFALNAEGTAQNRPERVLLFGRGGLAVPELFSDLNPSFG